MKVRYGYGQRDSRRNSPEYLEPVAQDRYNIRLKTAIFPGKTPYRLRDRKCRRLGAVIRQCKLHLRGYPETVKLYLLYGHAV
jgi:hypothetical protein